MQELKGATVTGGSDDIVSQIGSIFSKYTLLFDLTFARLVGDCDGRAEHSLKRVLSQFEELCVADNGAYKQSAKKCIDELDALERCFNLPPSSAEVAGRVVERAFGLSRGEAEFLSAYVILGLAKGYLSARACNTLLPEDKITSRKLLQKKIGLNYAESLKLIDFSVLNRYFRHTYIVGEYREDLLMLLESFRFSQKQRLFRRLYADAGYGLRAEVTSRELIRLVALSGELAQGTFLCFLKESGFLENLL